MLNYYNPNELKINWINEKNCQNVTPMSHEKDMIVLIALNESDRSLTMSDKFHFGTNVLVVDDQETNQMVMDGILKYYYGIDASFANNGQEAIEMVSKGDYDLIFMDIHMPIMNGIEATRAIMFKNPNMPIVAVTTSALDETRAECLDAGMLECLVKPIDLEALKKVIQPYLLN